jgi:hypothetical protein
MPGTHPLLENETLDDRALEGVWLGNDLRTPMFWMYSFKLRKVVRLSDPHHFDHILPFLRQNSGELDTGEPNAAEHDKESPSTAQHKVLLGPKDYKRLKHDKEVPLNRASIPETTTDTSSRTS